MSNGSPSSGGARCRSMRVRQCAARTRCTPRRAAPAGTCRSCRRTARCARRAARARRRATARRRTCRASRRSRMRATMRVGTCPSGNRSRRVAAHGSHARRRPRRRRERVRRSSGCPASSRRRRGQLRARAPTRSRNRRSPSCRRARPREFRSSERCRRRATRTRTARAASGSGGRSAERRERLAEAGGDAPDEHARDERGRDLPGLRDAHRCRHPADGGRGAREPLGAARAVARERDARLRAHDDHAARLRVRDAASAGGSAARRDGPAGRSHRRRLRFRDPLWRAAGYAAQRAPHHVEPAPAARVARVSAAARRAREPRCARRAPLHPSIGETTTRTVCGASCATARPRA